ncbi:MAG: hypothetical protein Q7U57_07645 [Methylovulum sp.]|nr:hypothetical protein [Methylovulum sp.]
MQNPTKTNAFATNFNHRLSDKLDASSTKLYECLNPALERAASICDLMEVAFGCGMENELSNLWRAAQAIRFEILDAQAVLNAYVDGASTTPGGNQSGAEDESVTDDGKINARLAL